ncbi:MAG TPA: SDR family NAD(P)-dependent oxidoreductase [Fimbriimonas sp.]|nr:SDR family NAD(P)-dependent oxidoreductase [Fimbriimonas sp.]
MERLLEGKVVIVTGGARGIGAQTCEVMAEHGARVVINYSSSTEKARAVLDKVQAMGAEAMLAQADVRDQVAVNGMVEQAMARFGRIDGLINNAISGTQDGRFDAISDDDFQNMFDFNCLAVARTTRAVRPIMQAQGGGRIVNIVTEIWNMGPGGWSAYMAGKGAMVGISRSLAEELGPDNITVNMVSPGWMATEKVDTSSEGSRKFADSLPLKRHGSGHEIGKACVFFISDLGSYVTGAYLPVTGGRVTQMGS